jgi:hypothetical protein
MDPILFSKRFYLEHISGDRLYAVRIKNRETGKSSFRLSAGGKGGNLNDMAIEEDDDQRVEQLVFSGQFAVRASTLNGSRKGLYKLGKRSITRAVRLT